jgi:16S rRNA (cytosine967-C5)-methyltransferase
VDLRVNTIKMRREEVQARLAAEGFATDPTPWSPVGLRLRTRASVFHSQTFKEGLIEVQDEGSQLVSLLLEPRRGEMIVDFCAGAGGKTLHLGALMANTGSLYAFDVSAARLERLAPRLARSGLSNVRPVAIAHERDDRVKRLHGKIDRVLVDAPCTGTGTLRRNPDIKWRGVDLAALTAGQERILAAAALLLKPGGRLVYATCSLLREENQDIVQTFLDRNPAFRAVAAAEILARRHVELGSAERDLQPHSIGEAGNGLSRCSLRLLPHRHGTDGFYAVALERTA